MRWLRWVIAALALLVGGWMAFDGGRALVVGEYVTPAQGPHAGELGPWKLVVAAVGIDPRSTLMKSIFLVYGLAWVGVIALFLLGARPAPVLMIVFAAGSLWYLPFGTLLGVIQVTLLMWLVQQTPRMTA